MLAISRARSTIAAVPSWSTTATLAAVDGLCGTDDDVDDARVDERGLAQVEDQSVSSLERTVSLVAEAWRVRQIEFSLEADGDDLVRLRDNTNDSIPVLGAEKPRDDACMSFLLRSGPIDRPAQKSGLAWAPRLAVVPVHEERSNVGVRFVRPPVSRC